MVFYEDKPDNIAYFISRIKMPPSRFILVEEDGTHREVI